MSSVGLSVLAPIPICVILFCRSTGGNNNKQSLSSSSQIFPSDNSFVNIAAVISCVVVDVGSVINGINVSSVAVIVVCHVVIFVVVIVFVGVFVFLSSIVITSFVFAVLLVIAISFIIVFDIVVASDVFRFIVFIVFSFFLDQNMITTIFFTTFSAAKCSPPFRKFLFLYRS